MYGYAKRQLFKGGLNVAGYVSVLQELASLVLNQRQTSTLKEPNYK
jgi:hypothetical protein